MLLFYFHYAKYIYDSYAVETINKYLSTNTQLQSLHKYSLTEFASVNEKVPIFLFSYEQIEANVATCCIKKATIWGKEMSPYSQYRIGSFSLDKVQ